MQFEITDNVVLQPRFMLRACRVKLIIYTRKGNRSKLAPDYGANDVKKSFKLLELIEVLHSVAKL